MANDSVTLINNNNGESREFPIHRGTIGPGAFDIASLYKETGIFTYDPGFMATASCSDVSREMAEAYFGSE